MSDQGRNGTPPLAAVKEEDSNGLRKMTATVNTLSFGSSSASATSPSIESTSRLSVSPEPELELPPRMKSIFEKALRTQPKLVKERYADFLRVEQSAPIRREQDAADHIKLTRIFIPLWADKYISEEKRKVYASAELTDYSTYSTYQLSFELSSHPKASNVPQNPSRSLPIFEVEHFRQVRYPIAMGLRQARGSTEI